MMASLLIKLRTLNPSGKILETNFKRSFSSAISQSPLSALRKRTGLAYSLCREALNKHDNNVEKAEAWLTAESLRHGWQKATKLNSRSAREGLIGLMVNETHSTATILEVNCETDFVARNGIFRDFVEHLTKIVATTPKFNSQQRIEAQNEAGRISTKKFLIPERELKIFDEEIFPIVTKLGERIKLSRAAIVQSQSDRIGLYGGVHAGTDERSNVSHDTVMIGRFASVVGLELLSDKANVQDEMYEQIGRRLCKHIIGYSPAYIELPASIREHLVRAAKEEREAQSLTDVNNESTEDYDSDAEEKDAIKSSSTDDWPSMMDQPLIMDDTTSVRQYCEEKQIKIVDINRFECGDETNN